MARASFGRKASAAMAAALGFACAAASAQNGELVCTRLAQVQLSPGEFVRREDIPAGARISVTAQTERMWQMTDLAPRWASALAPGTLLLAPDGVRVVRVTQARRFHGYVASVADGRATLFRSPQFRGTGYNGWFFRRVVFRPVAATGCGGSAR